MSTTHKDLDDEWARQLVERAWRVSHSVTLRPPASMKWHMHHDAWDALCTAHPEFNGTNPIDPIAKTLFGIPVVCWPRTVGEHIATFKLVITD